jgi:hypothetical protein
LATTVDGFEHLLSALDDSRQGRVAVAIEDVRLALEGAKGRGWPWPKAWSAAINRVQPINREGIVLDPVEADELLEARTLLEEDRVAFRAAYENREMTDRENAERLLVARARVGVDAA